MAGEVKNLNAAGVPIRLDDGKDVVQGDGEAFDQLAAGGVLDRLIEILQLLMLLLEVLERR